MPPVPVSEDSLDYQLLPTSAREQPECWQPHMGQEEQFLKPEGRQGDLVGKYIALSAVTAILVTTWITVLCNDPKTTGWFAIHPLLQTLSILLFTYGILTLQPTSQPKTKTAGLARHQVAIFLLGFPCIIFGTFAVAYNKWIHNKEHMTTWHGTFGYLSICWILVQVILGGGSVWFQGSAFGGGMKAKRVWKYHRLSGYLLFTLLLFTVHLGGTWSDWGTKRNSPALRVVAYTLAPGLTLVSLLVRVRLSKMKII